MTDVSTLDASIRAIVRDVVREELRAVLDEHARTGFRNVAREERSDGYLSITHAARLADIAPGTLRRWIREGRLPTRRAGRVHRVARADLDAFLRTGADANVVNRARSILARAD